LPDTVRIYPTVVLENTYLAYLFKNGKYLPQTVENAAELCAVLLEIFDKNNINVIRLGLHSINEEDFVAGPWHPSFSELCWNNIYYKELTNKLSVKGNYIINVAKGEISKAIGQHKTNYFKLKEQGFVCKFKEDASLLPKEIKIIKDV
jgi:histone acetyltransferase (RNA polymerase elongator complex component)